MNNIEKKNSAKQFYFLIGYKMYPIQSPLPNFQDTNIRQGSIFYYWVGQNKHICQISCFYPRCKCFDHNSPDYFRSQRTKYGINQNCWDSQRFRALLVFSLQRLNEDVRGTANNIISCVSHEKMYCFVRTQWFWPMNIIFYILNHASENIANYFILHCE